MGTGGRRISYNTDNTEPIGIPIERNDFRIRDSKALFPSTEIYVLVGNAQSADVYEFGYISINVFALKRPGLVVEPRHYPDTEALGYPSPGSPKPESTEGVGIKGLLKGCKGAPLNLG